MFIALVGAILAVILDANTQKVYLWMREFNLQINELVTDIIHKACMKILITNLSKSLDTYTIQPFMLTIDCT